MLVQPLGLLSKGDTKWCCRRRVFIMLQAILLLWGYSWIPIHRLANELPTAWEFLQLYPLKLGLICLYSSPPPRTWRRWWCGSQRSTPSNVFLLAKRGLVISNQPQLLLWLDDFVLNQPQGSIYGSGLPFMCSGLFYFEQVLTKISFESLVWVVMWFL